MAQRAQLEIRKNDKGTLHLGCGQLSRKNVPPSARAENCHLLKKVDENFKFGFFRQTEIPSEIRGDF